MRTAKSRPQRRRRKGSRPTILRYRWWFVTRSRLRTRIVLLLLLVAPVLAFALLRRLAAQPPEAISDRPA